MGDRLQGKIAVVTGSTSGIGEAIARRMAAEGAKVVVSGRRESEGERVAESIRAAGGTAVYQRTDVSIPEQCRRVCVRAQEEFGGLDCLVNNAAIFPRMPFEETTPEFWDSIFDVNVRGAFLCCQAAVPLMRERGGGSIVNIGSANAFGTGERLIAYGTSKSALYGMSVTLARHLAHQKIRVNWVTVGWVLTEKEFEVQEQQEGNDRETMLARAARFPMGRYTEPEEIATACVFLASDETAGMAGCNLAVSAGMGIRF